MNSPIGLYRPGNSLLHRCPAGVKLAVLVAAGAGSILVREVWQVAVALGVVLLAHVVAWVSPRVVWASFRPLLWVLVPLTVFQVVVVGWQRAVVIVGVIVALVLLANLVTLTTRSTDLIDVVVWLCRPLRVVGIEPERVGLMLNLAIRAVPLMVELGDRVREAQLARGNPISARAFAVPLIVGALRRSDELGDALAARGLED